MSLSGSWKWSIFSRSPRVPIEIFLLPIEKKNPFLRSNLKWNGDNVHSKVQTIEAILTVFAIINFRLKYPRKIRNSLIVFMDFMKNWIFSNGNFYLMTMFYVTEISFIETLCNISIEVSLLSEEISHLPMLKFTLNFWIKLSFISY